VAWRRPLTQVEVARIAKAASASAKSFGTIEAGLEGAISALLQSPNFLYIVEIGEPDEERPEVRRLTMTELATRMSMFLLNQTPDADLLSLAESGKLEKDDDIRALAQKLVGLPEAKEAVREFYAEAYRLRDLEGVSKDAAKYPEFTPALKAAMREET